METIDSKNLDPQFKYDVAQHPGGDNIQLCFACGTCTAACPVAEIDDQFNPRKIIRQVLLGMRKEVLSESTIWKCAQCYACTAKCPQNVKFKDIIRALREMAVEEKYVEPDRGEKIEQIDKLWQKNRQNMISVFLKNPEEFDKLKDKLERITK